MLRPFTLLLIALSSVTGNSQEQREAPDHIKNFILDPRKEIEVPVSQRHATTLHFPEKIAGVIGYGLTDGEMPGTYQFSNPPNSNVVTVRNVMADKDCYMTCVMENQSYIFHLVPSDNPVIALKLDSPKKSEIKLFGPVSTKQASERKLEYSTESLIQSIRKARSRDVWEQTYPEWYANAHRRLVAMPTETDQVKANIEEIHQFPADDTLVFLGSISNKTTADIWLQPYAFRIRVGERLYPAQMVDFPGDVSGEGTANIAIVLRGNSTAGREHLALENEFRVVLPEALDPESLAHHTADLPEFGNAAPTILPEK